MTTTTVVLQGQAGEREVTSDKSAYPLLVKVASGRITKATVQAARMLTNAEAVMTTLTEYPTVKVMSETRKERKESIYTLSYLQALAGIPTDVFGGVRVRLLESNRGRRASKAKVVPEVLEV